MISHYLMFNRNCAEALKLYEAAFGARLGEVQTYGDMPPNPDFPVPESDKGLVLHARFTIGGAEFMCADSSGRSDAGNNMYVSVTEDAAFVQKAWDALKPGSEIYMDLAPSFFASLHGSLRDRFGISWMFTAPKQMQ